MEIEDVRVAVYRWCVRHGSTPSKEELAKELDLDSTEVQSALIELAQHRHLVLDEKFRIVMAHPFSDVPLGFSVMGPTTLWWGGCSWDSFALPNLLESKEPFLVATNCPNCSKALAWNVSPDSPPQGDEVAHFLVPVSRMWEDVVHTCGNQRIYCSQQCLDSWLEKTQNELGYVMKLDTLWNLASNWYVGRLTKGYLRREPSEAKEYFRQCGLSGPFWGLD